MSTHESSTISFQDFLKVDVRVGRVIRVEEFPEARKASYKLWIDFGDLGVKQSSAQITDRYHVEDLKDRQVVAVVNFPPKQIANFMSEVLLLGAIAEEEEVVLLSPDVDVREGDRVA
jgi:tRNA-binding protein